MYFNKKNYLKNNYNHIIKVNQASTSLGRC